MTRGQFYGRVVPMLAVAYAIVLVAFRGAGVAAIGAMVFALCVMAGAFLTHPHNDPQVDGAAPRTQRRAVRQQRRRMRG